MRLLKIIPALLALAFATSTPAAPAPAKAHTDLQFSHLLDEERAERLEKLVDRFNEQQKDVTLKLVRRVEGDAPKQINLVTRDEQSRFVASRGKFKPLHEVMHEAKEPFDVAKLSPELRVGLSDAKGKLVALPVAMSTPVLYFNKAAFRKAGLDPENPPKTRPSRKHAPRPKARPWAAPAAIPAGPSKIATRFIAGCPRPPFSPAGATWMPTCATTRSKRPNRRCRRRNRPTAASRKRRTALLPLTARPAPERRDRPRKSAELCPASAKNLTEYCVCHFLAEEISNEPGKVSFGYPQRF